MGNEITVIVPYYNEESTIEYTLERVGMQSLPAKAAVFVNSSSSDSSSIIVDNWIKKNQARFITRFSNVFVGTRDPGSSKNVGIVLSNTEWVAFMDCGQEFDFDWLRGQMSYAIAHQLEVVSGVVYLTGANWLDRCAVAQTYGYKRSRPCLPTTLVKKSVFERTGLLLEGRRAGYDTAWPIRLKRLGIQRGVNREVRISYIGTNYASTLPDLLRKSVQYAKPTVGIEGIYTPWLYLMFTVVGFYFFLMSKLLFFILFGLYVVARVFVLPVCKSRGWQYFKDFPTESILRLGFVGLVIDIGKTLGILQGVWHYYLKDEGRAL
jgi:glycosyltransferase involved in cell wall biosynthesis